MHVRHGPFIVDTHARQLNHFHTTRLLRLLHIKWQHRIPDTEVLKRAKLPSVHTLLQNQLRWTGHVVRMENTRISKQLLYGELTPGKRTVGGRKKALQGQLKGGRYFRAQIALISHLRSSTDTPDPKTIKQQLNSSNGPHRLYD